MIKVIASDLDGTLLGEDHKIASQTSEAIQCACDFGIRFIIVTGRNFQGAIKGLEGAGFVCDYLVSSGAEVRNAEGVILRSIPIDNGLCKKICAVLKKYPVTSVFSTDKDDYRVDIYRETEFAKSEGNFRNRSEDLSVYKIFLRSEDREMLRRIEEELEAIKGIAVSSSFSTNLEITDSKAQKGPVLKEYIESLGYQMSEVMIFGDSRNDSSMFSMDFGATIAMENAEPEIKEKARYVTKSNTDWGVAYAINELLRLYGQFGS